jgi:glycerol-3-phosphate acyltransferase PlsX
MGGDEAPQAVVEGALLACDPQGAQKLPYERVLLVGDETRVKALLKERGAEGRGFPLRHASQVIGMEEKPGQALRAKPDSSIAGCVAAIRSGEAGAMVSMGNTGAVVGSATLGLGTLEGVRRPGIAVTLALAEQQPVTFLDMGANVACKAQHLYQYGVMGSVYVRDCLKIENPRIALINIGEEASKGTELLRDAHSLLEASSLNFVGNVEPGDLFAGGADVLITDGFTGNTILKLMEGFASFMMGLVSSELAAHKVQWGAEALGRVKRAIDYSEYGGALVLGIAGTVVVGHGRSLAPAVANALGVAARTLDVGVDQHIVRGLEEGRVRESSS